jgi:IS30 family transposase
VEVALRGKALAQDEREDISRGLAAGLSMRAIARSLRRTTLCRIPATEEVRRLPCGV